MKLTNEKITRIVVFGFIGEIIIFIIGAATVVLMPFALIYAVGYLILLLVMFALYIKNKPAEFKRQLAQIAELASSPELVHASAARRGRKAAARRRKKQLRRSRRQARLLVFARAANKSVRDFLK